VQDERQQPPAPAVAHACREGTMTRSRSSVLLVWPALALAILAGGESPTLGAPRRTRSPAPVSPPPPASPGAAAAAGRIELEILHTNDLHGHIRPGVGRRGGAGAIAARVEAARQRARTDPAYDVVVVDAGDAFGGTAEDALTHGRMMADFLASVPYDVFTIGNHDFGHGLTALTESVDAMRRAGVVVLGANIRNQEGGAQAERLAAASVLIRRKNVALGVIGVTTPGVERMNLDEDVRGLAFVDPIPAVEKAAAALKREGASVIVLVSHVGLDNGPYVDDKKIARAVADVRAIVGGHSHTVLKAPIVEPTHRTLIVQAGSNARGLGSLTLHLDAKTGRPIDADGDGVVDHAYALTELATVPGAHALADRLAATYWDPLKPQLDRKVGIAKETLYRKFYKTETPLGNLVADSVLAAVPGAQIAITAASDLRSDLFPGDIQMKDVFSVLPFENAVVKLPVRGSLIAAVMDDCYGHGRHFAHVAGMKVVADSRKPDGQRVRSIEVGGEPLSPDREYVLATSDFIAQGKAGFSQFERPAYEATGVKVRDAVVRRIETMAMVNPDSIPDGRLRDLFLSEEVGRVTTTYTTNMFGPGPTLFDLVAHGALGSPARADFALIDADEIHWRLSERFPVTRRDLYELASFDNPLVVSSITGDQLKSAMAPLVQRFTGERRFRAYLAGATIVIHGTQFELLVGDRPVEPARAYRMLTTNHLLDGPRGFEALGALSLAGQPAGIKMREALERWIRQMSPVGPEHFPARPSVIVGQPVERTAGRLVNFERMESPAAGASRPARPAARPRSRPSARP
jgi:5'-nucleotidase